MFANKRTWYWEFQGKSEVHVGPRDVEVKYCDVMEEIVTDMQQGTKIVVKDSMRFALCMEMCMFKCSLTAG
jgi:hypothetical protein